MSLAWLGVAYLVIGLVLGRLAWARARGPGSARFASAALTIVLWPLWAPFVLEGPRKTSPLGPVSGVGDEILAGIDAARAACEEADLDPVLSGPMAERLRAEVARAVGRIAAIERTLDTPHFDPDAAQERVRTLEGAGDASRLASASLHAQNVRRMRALLEADRRALAELVELLRALRSQLALARFAGSVEADASGIVRDVWSRVEGLGAVIEPEGAATPQARGFGAEDAA